MLEVLQEAVHQAELIEESFPDLVIALNRVTVEQKLTAELTPRTGFDESEGLVDVGLERIQTSVERCEIDARLGSESKLWTAPPTCERDLTHLFDSACDSGGGQTYQEV